MNTNSRDRDNGNNDRTRETDINRAASKNADLPDSPHDAERLKGEETIIELPDVKDIPGQEFVHVMPLGMLSDTTISSADEEGEGLFEDDADDTDDEAIPGTEADVTREEKIALRRANLDMPTDDESRLRRAAMDNTDFEGEPLNEGSFGQKHTGSDLDIPDAIDETTTDALGQGDEENDYYSLGSDNNDNVTEGTP